MRGKGWLWATLALGLMSLSALAGWQAARWQAGLVDLLCSGDFADYRTTVALDDGAGLTLPAGTRLRVRFCEYSAQAQLELLIDKGEFTQLQPVAAPEGERWLYNLRPATDSAARD